MIIEVRQVPSFEGLITSEVPSGMCNFRHLGYIQSGECFQEFPGVMWRWSINRIGN